MVTSVTNFSRSGMSDWLLQRVSAVLLAVYTIALGGYIVCTGSDLTYEAWAALMGSVPMKVINTLVVASIAGHAWVGLWTVTTDYLTRMAFGNAATCVRLVGQTVLALLLAAYSLWALWMIWGAA
ncbi:succinate dehydrogenase, hydrophobic membrane anchor protein [Isoalcanivorax beigongshangi]|uniref:Succinate dehydrogenase hydrophobic membrane anchor subunit n=1 Tax=Isoalcanivorax beigongshangi TaxID=3238810 RepID=A0ABV4AGZ0_9GAMM